MYISRKSINFLYVVGFVCMVPKENKEEKKEEAKKEGKEEKEEEKKEEKKEEEPQEIVLKVDMHCEACARKVARALKGFQGDLFFYCRSLHVSHVYSLFKDLFWLNICIYILDLTYHSVKVFVVFIFIILGTGVEDVTTDSKASKVVVKGKTADPIKVCERIQKKSGRKVELISPLPKPPEENKEEPKEAKEEEKKEEVLPPLLSITHTIKSYTYQ